MSVSDQLSPEEGRHFRGVLSGPVKKALGREQEEKLLRSFGCQRAESLYRSRSFFALIAWRLHAEERATSHALIREPANTAVDVSKRA